MDSSGTILSTDQFGTTGDEELPTSGGVVAVDPAGNLFITGVTDGAFNGYTNAGGYDLFVYKIDAKSTSTSTSTYSSNLAAVAKCDILKAQTSLYILYSHMVAYLLLFVWNEMLVWAEPLQYEQ